MLFIENPIWLLILGNNYLRKIMFWIFCQNLEQIVSAEYYPIILIYQD